MNAIHEAYLDDGFQAITSLSRAVASGARLPDVGPLFWVVLRQMVPCDAMALFVPDAARATIAVGYAAGAHSGLLAGVTRPAGSGIAGWVAVNRHSVVNAEPIFDFGFRVSGRSALRSSVVVPLVDNGEVVAVLALYSKQLLAFTDAHVATLELLAQRLALALTPKVAATRAVGPAAAGRSRLRLLPVPVADGADHRS